jgi:hypothetical protein
MTDEAWQRHANPWSVYPKIPQLEAGWSRISLCNILEISENRQPRNSSILVTSDRWYSARQIKAFAEFQ